MRKIFLISFLFLFLALGQVQAAGLVPCGGHEEPPCTFCHLFAMINDIVKWIMFVLVPVIAVLMLLVGGVMFFFAGGAPKALIQARGIITSVVVGLVIVFCSWIIVNTVITKIGIVDPVEGRALLEWYEIQCPAQ